MFFLSLVLLGGCGTKPNETSQKDSSNNNLKQPEKVTPVDDSQSMIAEEEYQAFLEGFRTVHVDGNTSCPLQKWDGIPSGDYSEETLRLAVADHLGTLATRRYAVIYPNQGEEALLVLNYADLDNQWFGWYLVIACTEDGLKVCYEFASMLGSQITKDGIAVVDVSYGAYGWANTWVQINGDGSSKELSKSYWVIGPGVNMFARDISNGRQWDEPDLKGDEQFIVSASIEEDKVYFRVQQYSMYDEMRKSEEAVVAELKKSGAIEVPDQESEYLGDIIEPDWIYENDFEMNESSAWYTQNEINHEDSPYIEMREVDQGTYGDVFYELAEGSYTRTVEVTFPYEVTDMRLFKLEEITWDEEGTGLVQGEIVESLKKMAAGTTMILQIQIDEYRPNNAIMFTTNGGASEITQTFYIGESGLDGSLYLSPCIVEW